MNPPIQALFPPVILTPQMAAEQLGKLRDDASLHRRLCSLPTSPAYRANKVRELWDQAAWLSNTYAEFIEPNPPHPVGMSDQDSERRAIDLLIQWIHSQQDRVRGLRPATKTKKPYRPSQRTIHDITTVLKKQPKPVTAKRIHALIGWKNFDSLRGILGWMVSNGVLAKNKGYHVPQKAA